MAKQAVTGASWGDADEDGNITAMVIVSGNPGTVSRYQDDDGNMVEQTDITPIPFTFPAEAVIGGVFEYIKANFAA